MRTRCDSRADEMHFDARCGRVPDRPMLEGLDVEVGVELAIHADEQVPVEGGGHAERVVIREQEVALRFQQVSANQQRVVRPQRAADRPQKLGGARRIEVADVRSEEQDQRPPAVMARQGFEPRFVRRLMAFDLHVVCVERPGGEIERG